MAKSNIQETILSLALILICVGGLNWGLVGVFDFNLVNYIFGKIEIAEKTIYILVGAASIYTSIYIPHLLKRS